MKNDKSALNSAVLNRRQQRRASIQWFAVALVIGLTLLGTFLYLISQDRGVETPGGGVHSGQIQPNMVAD